MAPGRYAFVQDDLSLYERIDPGEFPDYDAVDSRDIRIDQEPASEETGP